MTRVSARLSDRRWLLGLGAVLLIVGLSVGVVAAAPEARPAATFKLFRSQEAEGAGCLANATGKGQIFRQGPGVERMVLSVSGMPRNEEFEVFVIQQPTNPFGLAWYLGDIQIDRAGKGSETFIGRFNITTAVLGVGVAPAPVIHTAGPFPDLATNPDFSSRPVHTFHVGLWFDSDNDALEAGCPNTNTPFSGVHAGGIQALSTRNVNDLGPLAKVVPRP